MTQVAINEPREGAMKDSRPSPAALHNILAPNGARHAADELVGVASIFVFEGQVSHFHTLRANFISRLVNSGLSESQVMFRARHRSLSTSHKYYVAFD